MKTYKLSRKTGHRKSLTRNLVTSLVLYETIRTTEAKAKSIVPVAERLITHARTGSLAARRSAKALLFDMNAVRKLFEDFPERYGDRTSGFVRLTKLPTRPGDQAAMAKVELLLTPLDAVIEQSTKTKLAVRKKDEAPSSEEDTK